MPRVRHAETARSVSVPSFSAATRIVSWHVRSGDGSFERGAFAAATAGKQRRAAVESADTAIRALWKPKVIQVLARL
jgi:hypothetical protein